jgi:cytochrome c peroxidase
MRTRAVTLLFGRAVTLLFGALAPLATLAAGEVQFTEAEVRAVLAHGPWPAPLTIDPTNRASGRDAAIELGERLFFDTRLSINGRFSCATHAGPEPEVGAFKVPTLRHLMLTAPYGHDGKRETLAEVVRHCSERGSAALPALGLTPAEQTDLVVFLESISTLSNPWRPSEDHNRCR